MKVNIENLRRLSISRSNEIVPFQTFSDFERSDRRPLKNCNAHSTLFAMSAIRKKKAQISSKLKHMIHKHSKSENIHPRPDNCDRPSVQPTFRLSHTNRDTTAEVLENLWNFKIYLEKDPSDPESDLMSVTDNFSTAVTALRHRTADFQVKLAGAQAASADLDVQESHIRTRKRELAAQLASLQEERATLLPVLARLQFDGEKQSADLTRSKGLKKRIIQKRDDFTSLDTSVSSLEAEIARQTVATLQLQSELSRLRLEIQGREQKGEFDFTECQRRIHDLTIQAKQAEAEKEQAKVQEKNKRVVPVLLTPDVSAFVIEDRVKISRDDAATLRFMIEALREENERLIGEMNDGMMDVDCLMQENIGLKQIIRQLLEGE
jgi:hypothetical protein